MLSYTAFTAKYKIKTNFLEFNKAVSAVKLFRQKCSQQLNKGPKTSICVVTTTNAHWKYQSTALLTNSSFFLRQAHIRDKKKLKA